MGFFQNIGQSFSEAVSFVGEKSRRAAYLNRIRSVIRCEEKAAEKEYLALGRYYYHNLRDANDPVTEAHCVELDGVEARLESALTQLDLFYQMGQQDSAEAAAVAVIPDKDGPTAVFEKDSSAEEITLEDVECYDSDPTQAPPVSGEAADPTENDDLPFEG